jgi:ribosomal-protein-alanine N-acetyltransferase
VSPPESFSTERLLLRKPRKADAPLIYESYAQDPEVSRFLTFRPHGSVRETEAVVERFLAGWSSGKSFCWMIFRRDGQELVGSIAAREHDGLNLGYLLAKPYWKCGFMSEALQMIVSWGFSESSIFRVWAVCDTDNHASARLLARNGFQLEGLLRKWSLHPNVSPEPRDCYCYARIR